MKFLAARKHIKPSRGVTNATSISFHRFMLLNHITRIPEVAQSRRCVRPIVYESTSGDCKALGKLVVMLGM
jgi:hypothetical protein